MPMTLSQKWRAVTAGNTCSHARLNADRYIPALLQGVFGSKNWMAGQPGAAQRAPPHIPNRLGSCYDQPCFLNTIFWQAKAKAQAMRAAGHAVSARYDARHGWVIVRLNTGVDIAFPVELAQGLAGADRADLAQIEISPAGTGLHWPRLDADLYIPALLQGVFGSKNWMARQLGAAGGAVRSDAKKAAARANGAKGGRPRKRAAEA